jgi:DNA gyrase subunit A
VAGTSRSPIASEIRDITAADELGQSFLPYSLSVITARALPDVRDGLKPVQRRILVAMNEMGLRPNSPHRKSAKVVGETMGNYHPHGDSAIYEALVRLGQPFSMRVPLVDPHGNFGSLDDPPAAPRYTECRLSEAAMDLLGELDEDTVEFRPTYDGEGAEPEYLPARLPNLLVNGSSGIAVGMATNMPPHNLVEVCNTLAVVLHHRSRPTLDELMELLPGPDFPTGGVLVDDGGLREAYSGGRGGIRIRARAEIAQVTARRQGIVVTELPFNVGPERVISRINELVMAGKLSAITDVKDLTDRKSGMRIQIECKTGSDPQTVLTELYRLTPMEESFGINNVVLVDGVPTTVGLYELCRLYLDHRLEVVVRRTRFRLRKAQERAHILEGLLIALDNIDQVIRIIRGSATVDIARAALQRQFQLSDVQATAILNMMLRRLVALERQELIDELAGLRRDIAEFEKILGSERRQRTIVGKELDELAQRRGTPRRTRIANAEEAPRLTAASAPQSFELGDNPCVLTLSTSGVVGRELDGAHSAKGRLGRHDVLIGEVHTSNRRPVWAITDRGRALTIAAFEVPEVSGRARGAATSELFSVLPGEKALDLIGELAGPLVLVTAAGALKRISADELASARDGGSLIGLDENDRLVAALCVPHGADVVLVASDAQALRTSVDAIPIQGRNARGVAGIKLRHGALVLAAGAAVEGGVVLTVSEGEAAKLTAVEEIPRQGRTAGGVRLTRLRPDDGSLRLAVVASTADLWSVLSQVDEPNKADTQPQPLPVAITRRDAASTPTARRVLGVGKARW